MSEKEVFSCLICGKEFEDLASAEFHVSEEHEEILGGGVAEHFIETSYLTEEERRIRKEDFERYCRANPDDEVCKKYFPIKEDREETPDETSEVLDEKDLVEQYRGLRVLEEFHRIPNTPEGETLKGQILSRALGQSIGKAHDKVFKEPVKIENWDKEYLNEIGEKISNGQCPFCYKTAEQLGYKPQHEEKVEKTLEQLGWREQHRELADKKIPMIIEHIRTEHIDLYKILKDFFDIPISERKYDDIERDDSESCSEREELSELEELSTEEAIERAKTDPDFRRMVFKAWKRKRESKRN